MLVKELCFNYSYRLLLEKKLLHFLIIYIHSLYLKQENLLIPKKLTYREIFTNMFLIYLGFNPHTKSNCKMKNI